MGLYNRAFFDAFRNSMMEIFFLFSKSFMYQRVKRECSVTGGIYASIRKHPKLPDWLSFGDLPGPVFFFH